MYRLPFGMRDKWLSSGIVLQNFYQNFMSQHLISHNFENAITQTRLNGENFS